MSLLALTGACTESPTWTPEEGEQRSLGAELYVVLCDRIAASEMPEDVRGHRSNGICHHDAPPVDTTPPRLAAIANNRVRLVSALDAALTSGPLDDDLGTFLTELLPFYDPPAELLPEVTRGFADVVTRLADDAEGLAAFQRISARQGYRPLEHAIGLLQAVLKYPRLHEFLVAFLDATAPEGKAHGAWTTLTSALALELATYQKNPIGGAETTLDVTHDLFFRAIENETPEVERYLARRDARGLVTPLSLCSGAGCMFVDDDGDGKADMDPQLGGLRGAGAPTPFRVLGLSPDTAARDGFGRALDGSGALLYDYVDVSRTFAGGLGRELLPLLARDDQGRSLVLDLMDALDVLLGPRVERDVGYGRATLHHTSRDPAQGVGLDLVRVLSVAGRSPDLEPMLQVVSTLVRDHETELAALIDAILKAKALADASDAKLAGPNDAWDEVIDWIGLMARTSRAPGQETMLEGLIRAIADERAKHFGDVVATMLRYRDGLHLDPNDKNGLPQGTFLTPVDRARPDTSDNRSIMQRSLHLVSEINAQRGICNKQVVPLIVPACSVMDYDDLGRVFGGAMSEEWELKLGPSIQGLINFLNAFNGGSTLESILGIKGLDSHPSPQALVRMLFADNTLVDLMLDPILVRNAPNADRQYWLKVVYANTIEAWEVPLDFADGQRASFWDAFRPLAEAFNRHDYDPLDAAHANDEHSFYIYMELASVLGRYYGSANGGHGADPTGPFYNVQADLRAYEGLVADMIASDQLVATDCTASAAQQDRCWVTSETLAQHPTNLGLFVKLHDVLRALDGITVGDGRDGIDIIASFAELMLNPHKACDPAGTGLVAPDGTGACDRADAPYPPVALRRTADDIIAATNLGVRYDGTRQGRSASFQNLIQDQAGRPLVEGSTPDVHLDLAKRDASGNKVPYQPRRYVAPLHQLLKTLNDVDAGFSPNVLPSGDLRLQRWRNARSGLVDRFFATDGARFENRTARTLLLSGLDFLRARLAKHRADGDLDPWLASLEGRSVEFARTPLVGATMDLFRASQEDPALERELSDLAAYLFDESTRQASFDTTLYALLDLVQVLRDDTNMVPTLSALSRLVAPNTPEAVNVGDPLALDDGALQRTTNLLRDILRVDEYASLSSLLENLVTTHPEHLAAGETPLETLVDVVAEVNRASPVADQGKQMTAEDFQATFVELRDFLLDERRGLERVFDIVQHRSGD